MKSTIAILLVSSGGETVARRAAEILGADRFALAAVDGFRQADALQPLLEAEFAAYRAWVFVGAVGIAVRAIAPHLRDKHTDPAVVAVDSTGRWIIPLLSGHVGGANALADRLAEAIGGSAVVTTQSDNTGLWPLDTLAERFGWRCEVSGGSMNEAIAAYLAGRSTALLLDVRGEGAHYLEQTAAAHVKVCYREAEVPSDAALVIALTPHTVHFDSLCVHYIPRVLCVGVGCRKDCDPSGIPERIAERLAAAGWAAPAVASVATIELKRDEPLVGALCRHFGCRKRIFAADELSDIDVPNPSERVREATGAASVSEAAAIAAAHDGRLVLEKHKDRLTEGGDFTFAVACDSRSERRGHIEIVGAGPGDPDLISLRGRRFLEEADLILYAGSLVPREVTDCARADAEVRSSAPLTLEEQLDLMKRYYDRGCLVVRLHTGDPCIYGAIQEQMSFFDRYGMRYHITPGISSFQAAAAELKSQFTIPERVQSIILTRGEGRTPMPDRERLRDLARSRSTMCIFLSAGIAAKVQAELSEHYPPETPVAVCHHLTWPDQRIWRGELHDLARIVEEHHLTLTTLIVVGEAIDNRKGLSRLYAQEFNHLFRP